MGGIAIIGLGKGYDRNAAPLKSYTDLFTALGGGHGGQTLTRGFIIINAAGEAVPYSTQLHTQFSPAQVAKHVNSGGVWIDYCGFPLYYQADAQGDVTQLGAGGWSQFANDLGPAPSHYGWLAKANFVVRTGVRAGITTQYQLSRGFPLDESLDGVCYGTGSMSLPGVGQSPQSADGYASMLAIHPPGGGHYFYAAWDPYRVWNAGGPQGVPLQTFADFITAVLQGDLAGVACQPYKTNYQKPAPTSTGQPSPTTVSNAPGPSGSKSSSQGASGGSGSTAKKKTTTPNSDGTCPAGYHRVGNVCVSTAPPATSGLPSWVAPASVAAGVVGLGVSAALLIREHHRNG